MEGNSVTSIVNGVFTPLVQFTDLDLGYNLITVIKENTFIEQENLEILNLMYNFITNVYPHVFRSLAQCTYLYLSNNRITEIVDGAFVGLVNLQ